MGTLLNMALFWWNHKYRWLIAAVTGSVLHSGCQIRLDSIIGSRVCTVPAPCGAQYTEYRIHMALLMPFDGP